MTLGILYWLFMILWLVLGLWMNYTPNQPYPFNRGAGHVLTFVLFLILGWHVFGAPVK